MSFYTKPTTMKIRIFAILSLIAGSFAFASCIDEEATNDVILANDKAAINAYLDTTSIVNVKEFRDEATGLSIIWQERAPSDTLETLIQGDTISVNYTGKFLTNKVFETTLESVARDNDIFSSNAKYEPIKFLWLVPGNRLITGFEFGVSQMEVGDKATVFIPSEFAYGREGSRNIGPNTPLIFELELVKVNPVKRQP